MTTFLDIIPSELVNIIFSYIDELECAINLINISSFNKLFNNTNFWKSLIKEKIGYLIEALDVDFISDNIYNIELYFRYIKIYNDIHYIYRDISKTMKDEEGWCKLIMKDKKFNRIDLIEHLIKEEDKNYLTPEILCDYHTRFELNLIKKNNILIYKLSIIIPFSMWISGKSPIFTVAPNEEQYMKIMFYGY